MGVLMRARRFPRYDRRVGFERFDSVSRNAFNEPVGGWALLGRAFARRDDVKDGEREAAGREMSALVARFTCRASDLVRGITPEDRLVLSGTWDQAGALQSGQVWAILGVKEVANAQGAEFEITAVLNRESQL
ncbi:head-tail adaptor protein [Mameliella alba]|nr:head-tail adaptor protein [Antarctobacter heliothermus]MBY6143355.1 head-tail adaptor protein [Mameliella alba]MCA0952921.1 head-tail adaptor protein [Mameliella alba]